MRQFSVIYFVPFLLSPCLEKMYHRTRRGIPAMFALALPLSALLLLFFADVAFADEVTLITSIEVEDRASCEAIGGSWDSASCMLSGTDKVTVTSAVTLTVAKGVTLRNEGGTVGNDGVIENYGEFYNGREGFFFHGTISNNGKLVNHGTLFNAGAPDRGNAVIANGESGTIYNDKGGAVVNHGDISGGAVENLGVLRNAANGFIGGLMPWEGQLASSGVISNAGAISVASMVNIGTLQNQTSGTVSTFGTPLGGGWLQNDGTVVNDGRFQVSGNMCCPGRLSNNGDFRNNGNVVGSGNSRLHNAGTFVNECLAPLQGYVLTGVPVVQLPCPGQSYFPLVAR